MVKDIKISDFDYELPDDRIARHPLAERDACKLLVSRMNEEILHADFKKLPSLIRPGSLLVCNNTRVINARIKFEKTTGSKIEVFLLEPLHPAEYVEMFQSRGKCSWSCMIGNLKRWKEPGLVKKLIINEKEVELKATRVRPLEGNAHEVEFEWNDDSLTFATIVDAAGYIPIPPYLRRESEDSDSDDYQTVYAEIKGSVAAPTAGLHFTEAIFDALAERHIDVMPVTLHVGAGTFQPVKSEDIGGHPMHTETFSVSVTLVKALIKCIKERREVVAVGTTSVRTLESLPYLGLHLMSGRENHHVTQWEAYDSPSFSTTEALEALADYMESRNISLLTASTSIMIAPGFRWRIVRGMVTNFHQPQSTLLLLVSSFLGDSDSTLPLWRRIYNEALANDYRFLSYGDACFFENNSL